MYDKDNLYHPKFAVKLLPKTSASLNEERWKVLLPETGSHYYLAINSTVLAVWGSEEAEVDKVARLLADKINVLIGNPPVIAGNYFFSEDNTREEDPPKVSSLEEVLNTLNPGSDPMKYQDSRTGLYD